MNTFGGLQVYVQANWPQRMEGTRVVRFPDHPHICWLARKFPWLGITPYTESIFPRMVDVDPMIAGNNLFCSARQFQELRSTPQVNTSSHVHGAMFRWPW